MIKTIHYSIFQWDIKNKNIHHTGELHRDIKIFSTRVVKRSYKKEIKNLLEIYSNMYNVILYENENGYIFSEDGIFYIRVCIIDKHGHEIIIE